MPSLILLVKRLMLVKKAKVVILQALKQSRTEMVQDFLDHKPEIYVPSYKFENSPALLKLAREKYFMTWLSSHWQNFNKISTHFSVEEKVFLETVFAEVFLELISKWSIVKTVDSAQINLGIGLVNDMQTALNQFLKAGEKADTMRNMLEIALEKNRVVFDRMIKQLSEENL